MRKPFIIACSALALLTSACGYGGDAPVSDAERELGAEQHPKLLAEFGGAYDGEEADYLKRVAAKVAASAGLGDQCTFTLVNSDVVNAFAVPGCYIYLTRGLLSIVNSEAELASVLAHEVGHIAADHSERQQRRSLLRGLGVIAVSLVTGSEQLSRVATAAATYFTLRYSRSHEYEADDLGLRYLKDAGYDPYAAADMLDALARNQQFVMRTRGRDEARSIPEWALTHPLTENRIARAREAARRTGVAPDALPENEAAYLRAVDGLLYGDDPEQGFVMGRRFAHPVMRIGFEAPAGFTLTNSPQAILIEGPEGMRGEFSGGRLPPGGLDAYPETVLASLLRGARVELGRAERRRVNGVNAIVVPAVVETPEGGVLLSLAAYEGRDGQAYHFLMISRPGAAPPEALERLFGSFRLLTVQEAASLRPRRIDVIEVGPADTLRSLAARMSAEDPLGHFLMLNGRTPDAPLRPGETVKLVVAAPRQPG